jgi:hypothetical protein
VLCSWVSVMENHKSKNRHLGEKIMLTEPIIGNCDFVVDQANKLYWGKSLLRNGADGHFFRTSLCLKQF